ncbi:UNVERIFIED_CONTAM: hypothetical protein FKN15_006943 [Acipenser sinensis]
MSAPLVLGCVVPEDVAAAVQRAVNVVSLQNCLSIVLDCRVCVAFNCKHDLLIGFTENRNGINRLRRVFPFLRNDPVL